MDIEHVETIIETKDEGKRVCLGFFGRLTYNISDRLYETETTTGPNRGAVRKSLAPHLRQDDESLLRPKPQVDDLTRKRSGNPKVEDQLPPWCRIPLMFPSPKKLTSAIAPGKYGLKPQKVGNASLKNPLIF